MIPKRIIYCWFGHGEMSDLNQRCMRSWVEKCPDYEIVRIDESNFDVNSNQYTKAAYENKNWSFVSDVARMQALKEFGGGFYLDTDAELLQPLDQLRELNCIVSEMAQGCYSPFFLGCGDEFPSLYQEYLGTGDERLIESKTAMWVQFSKLVYKYAHPVGETLLSRNGVDVLGSSIVSCHDGIESKRSIVHHHEENTWTSSWLGGFEIGSDFIPFNVYVNGTFNGALTDMAYGKERRPSSNMVMHLEQGAEPDVSVKGLGNYFNNPDVCEVEVSGKCVLKDTSKPKWNSVAHANGAIIRYIRTVVAIDFDDTITELQPRSCPTTGRLNETAARCIRQMHDDGVLIHIVTGRDGAAAEEARQKLHEWGIPYDNFQTGIASHGHKLRYDFIFDDRAYPDRAVPWEELTKAALKLRGCWA